jgi:hypothetical protein
MIDGARFGGGRRALKTEPSRNLTGSIGLVTLNITLQVNMEKIRNEYYNFV